MNKLLTTTLILLITAALVLTGCRPPEVEGTVVNLQKSQFDAALESAQNAIDKYPDNAEAWFYWGYINGEHTKNYEEMNRGFDKAMSLNPAQNVSIADRGITQSVEQAVTEYRTTAFADVFNPSIKKLQQAQQMEANDERSKLYAEVVEKMELALAISPDRSEPFQPLAIATLGAGDTSKAVTLIDKALASASDDADVLVTAGKVYLMAGEDEKATETFKTAAEVNPDNPVIFQELGNLHAQKDQWEDANAYYQQAIDMDPENQDLAYNIGLGYYKQQKYETAIDFFLQALDPDSDDPLVHRLVGSCYIQAQKYDEGVEFLEEAVDYFPDEASLWEFLAIGYGQKGMSAEADEAFQKSKELSGE